MIRPDGRLYDGMWFDGCQHGVGIFTTARKVKRKAEWSNGKRIRWLDEDDAAGSQQVVFERSEESEDT